MREQHIRVIASESHHLFIMYRELRECVSRSREEEDEREEEEKFQISSSTTIKIAFWVFRPREKSTREK